MGLRLPLIGKVGLVATALASCVVGASPVSAAPSSQFGAVYGGTITITGMGEAGPTSASYGGRGVATQLGASRTEGVITIVGPAPCQGGFAATHTDVLRASNGDSVYVAITETSCPRPAEQGTFDCTGTYTVTGGTGRYAGASGSGAWGGSVTFGPTGSGTFNTAFSGVLSASS